MKLLECSLKHHFDIGTKTHQSAAERKKMNPPPWQPHTCSQGPHPLKDNTTDKQLAPHYHQTAACRLVKLHFLCTEADICCCLLLSPDPDLLPPSTNCCLPIRGNEARRGVAGTRSAERGRRESGQYVFMNTPPLCVSAQQRLMEWSRLQTSMC